MFTSRYLTASPRETESVARDFAGRLKPGDVVALFGAMGAGKTRFVRGMAAGLGCTGEVSSPTFAIVHEYDGDIPLYHFDMYRISTWEDLYQTGFFDYLQAGNGVLAVEWSENIENALPDNAIRVTISLPPDRTETDRIIDIEDANHENTGD